MTSTNVAHQDGTRVQFGSREPLSIVSCVCIGIGCRRDDLVDRDDVFLALRRV